MPMPKRFAKLRPAAGRKAQRRLKKVDSSWVSGVEGLSLKDDGGKWDQFEANKRLLNISASFNENVHTTPLDKSSLTKQQVADAERLAAEIGSKPCSTNIHTTEERNMMSKLDGPRDEGSRGLGVPSSSAVSVAAAKSLLMDILRGKHRSTTPPPPKGNGRPKSEAATTSAPEWEPAAGVGTGGEHVGLAAAGPAATQTQARAKAKAKAPTGDIMTLLRRGGSDSGIDTGGSMVYIGGGEDGYMPHMNQQQQQQQYHVLGDLPQQRQQQQALPHASGQAFPHTSLHSSRHLNGHFFQQQQQQQFLPVPAGSSSTQMATQTAVPRFPPGSMSTAGAMGAGGFGPPHHMSCVPLGVPLGPMQPLYHTAMGQHPQQMILQPPPMAPVQLQWYLQQGMPVMAQPGWAFFPNQVQPQQQQPQVQLPPLQIPFQQRQQQPRDFMMQGHPGTGPVPVPPYSPLKEEA